MATCAGANGSVVIRPVVEGGSAVNRRRVTCRDLSSSSAAQCARVGVSRCEVPPRGVAFCSGRVALCVVVSCRRAMKRADGSCRRVVPCAGVAVARSWGAVRCAVVEHCCVGARSVLSCRRDAKRGAVMCRAGGVFWRRGMNRPGRGWAEGCRRVVSRVDLSSSSDACACWGGLVRRREMRRRGADAKSGRDR